MSFDYDKYIDRNRMRKAVQIRLFRTTIAGVRHRREANSRGIILIVEWMVRNWGRKYVRK